MSAEDGRVGRAARRGDECAGVVCEAIVTMPKAREGANG